MFLVLVACLVTLDAIDDDVPCNYYKVRHHCAAAREHFYPLPEPCLILFLLLVRLQLLQ